MCLATRMCRSSGEEGLSSLTLQHKILISVQEALCCHSTLPRTWVTSWTAGFKRPWYTGVWRWKRSTAWSSAWQLNAQPCASPRVLLGAGGQHHLSCPWALPRDITLQHEPTNLPTGSGTTQTGRTHGTVLKSNSFIQNLLQLYWGRQKIREPKSPLVSRAPLENRAPLTCTKLAAQGLSRNKTDFQGSERQPNPPPFHRGHPIPSKSLVSHVKHGVKNSFPVYSERWSREIGGITEITQPTLPGGRVTLPRAEPLVFATGGKMSLLRAFIEFKCPSLWILDLIWWQIVFRSQWLFSSYLLLTWIS